MERLLKKRDGIFRRIASIQAYLEPIYELETEPDPRKVSAKTLESERSNLMTYAGNYEAVYDELCLEVTDKDLKEVLEVPYEEFKNTCRDIENMIEKISHSFFPSVKSEPTTGSSSDMMSFVKELTAAQEATTAKLISSIKDLVDSKSKSSGSSDSEAFARLPKLDLPHFSGGYTQWREFFDIFVCAVHDRKNLAPVQKLQYLKGCLTGDAKNIIKTLTLKDENYPIAIKQLKLRYDNVKTIRDAHFANIFGLQQLNAKSAAGIRKVCSQLNENVQALKNLKEPTESWDSWLVYVLKNRLDSETRMEWERFIASVDNPKFEAMLTFLNEFASAIESAELRMGKSKPHTESKSSLHGKSDHPTNSNQAETGCFLCNDAHRLPQCAQFLSLTPGERKAKVLELRLCLNCFSRKHFVGTCVRPPSCRQCNGNHHPTLHFGQTQSAAHLAYHVQSEEILLSTALVKVKSPTSSGHVLCRALVDPGSQTSFITSSFVQRARLRRLKNNGVQVSGIGGIAKGKVTESVECDVIPVDQSVEKVFVQALVIDKVTGELPRQKVNIRNWPLLHNIRLADEHFQTPGPIDMLLGADVYPQILFENMKQAKSSDGKLIAQETIFGWMISGKVARSDEVSHKSSKSFVSNFVMTSSNTETDDILKRFWELEKVDEACAWSGEEQSCEAHFLKTFTREPSGRYAVALPFKDNWSLGESRRKAEFRLKQMERRLARDETLLMKYNDVIEEYFKLGHAEDAPITETVAYYMPHHGVIKEQSTTTKLRVVFDASAKSSNGASLNDCVMIGPKVQDDLFDILLRFRTHSIALSADIAKMYRQVKLCEADKDYHRFLWRKSPNDEIKDYRMRVVTFGVASSPHHAQRVLKQLACDDKDKFPLAAPVVEDDFYMDDLLSGVDDTVSGISLRQDLSGMLAGGGFELRKWSSSDPAVLEGVPMCDREIQETLDMDYDSAVTKTLGIYWSPATDVFLYKVNFPDATDTIVTKRQLLSDSARVFDPLGLLTPTTMIAKFLFQKLWLRGLNWDDTLPTDVLQTWLKWKHEMTVIDNLKYSRCIVPKHAKVDQYELHGFGDASEKGYSAAVYLRTLTKSGDIVVKLVCAKTKVAPIKQVSLPRLELCAALLVARLMVKVRSALKLPGVSLHGWSDSTVTLDWIRGSPNKWKTFVANRVSEIQALVSPSQWRYCPTGDNPSDCASRGIMPSQLVQHELWWQGPVWLSHDSRNWPTPHHVVRDNSQLDCEKRKKEGTLSHVAERKVEPAQLFPYSSLSKLVRITAWCLRWLQVRSSCKERQTGFLTCSELDRGLIVWIKQVQHECFSEDIARLSKKAALSSSSRLKTLCPFLDADGVLRVGGRLQSSNLPFSKKHPILLPAKHKLTDLIVECEHLRNLHAGPSLLLASLRQRYWILGARNTVRTVTHKCVECCRNRAESIQQIMGSLPKERLTPAKTFSVTGVDYAGPIMLKIGPPRGRSARTSKAWIALFVCFVVKAVHLELVSDLTTDAFIAALRRFIARRGKPGTMFSDNGTNFVGANRELRKLKSLYDSRGHKEAVARFLAEDNITWQFSPPRGSHFGGLWEAGVKSVKYHLHRVIGSACLTFEEMSTVLCQIEACLNSRPLCSLSTDPSDFSALTPGHFLVTHELNALPEPDVTDVPVNRLTRWQHLQLIHQHFWKRWSDDYLVSLQKRTRWQTPKRNVQIGDLVCIKDENLPPMKWLLGRVVELHPGKDKFVRVVTVKTAGGLLKRPVAKLTLIIPQDD